MGRHTLAAAGHPLSDFEKQSFLLIGLGYDYDPFVTSVYTRVDPLPIDELFGHLLAHEMRIEQHLPNIGSLQPAAHLTGHSPAYCGRPYHGCGSSIADRGSFAGQGSYRDHGFSSSRGCGSFFSPSMLSESPHHVCQLCHKVGHLASRCYSHFD